MYGSSPKAAGESAHDWVRELAPLRERSIKAIIDVSNKCNLRCRMCHFSFDDVFHQPAQHMRPEAFTRLAASILPHAHTLVLSAGNEPLMSPHFVEILKIASHYRVPEVYFITNGQLLTKTTAEAILEYGVTQVQISADGSTKRTYEYIRRGASFERLCGNLRYLSERKKALGRTLPLLQFNVVLMRSNLEELDTYVDLAESLGVEWIAARHLLQMSGLGMEQESLNHDHKFANYQFRRFMQRIDRSETVTVVTFPDFFDVADAVEPREESASIECTHGLASNLGQSRDLKPDGPAATPSGLDAPILPNGPDLNHRNETSALASHVRRSVYQRVLREICRIPRNCRRLLHRLYRAIAGPAQQTQRTLTLLRPECAPPFGCFDLPPEASVHSNNAIHLEGWALSRKEVAYITIERERSPADGETADSRGFIEIGRAKIINGSRPDVARVYPSHPNSWRSGWAFELRREMISDKERFETMIRVVAHDSDGNCADIGRRLIVFSREVEAKPYLFCARPFDSVFVDSVGNVRPYPDCRVEAPFGSLLNPAASFEEIWRGKEFTDLRQRIINRDPPSMCVTCAHFINRNVDDPAYFVPR